MEIQNPEPKNYPADLGMIVEFDLVTIEGSERLILEIVPDEFADFSLGYLGISTPLAQSMIGRKAGESVPYRIEGGIEIRIIQVTPSPKAPPVEIAKRRQAVMRKAVEQSDQTNAILFASSFSGKWGDYDPDTITNEPEEDQ